MLFVIVAVFSGPRTGARTHVAATATRRYGERIHDRVLQNTKTATSAFAVLAASG